MLCVYTSYTVLLASGTRCIYDSEYLQERRGVRRVVNARAATGRADGTHTRNNDEIKI